MSHCPPLSLSIEHLGNRITDHLFCALDGVLVSCGCHNFSSLTVLETRSLKLRCWQGRTLSEDSRGGSFLVSSSFWWPAPCGIPWLVAAVLSLSLSSCGFLLCVCVSGSTCPSSYKDTSHVGFRSPRPPKQTGFDPNLITSAKTRFLNRLHLWLDLILWETLFKPVQVGCRV